MIKTLVPLLLSIVMVPQVIHATKGLTGTRPNIIFVLTDDQGMGDLSCMGNPILRTPQLDGFHAKSTRFTDFHVSPTCAPTRGALMSGRHPLEVGISHTIRLREQMALDVVTLPQALQKAGYRTGLFGKWHLGDEPEYLPQNRGFDEVLMHGAGGIGQNGLGDFEQNATSTYFDSTLLHNGTIVKSQGFCTDVFFNAALGWIQGELKNKDPFFAYVSLNAPHGPMIAPDSWKKRFREEGYDGKTAARYGMIENIDHNFGQMMKHLEDWGALEDTLVIFMTDNGMSMGIGKRKGESIVPHNAGLRGRKNSPDEGGTRVPSFWYWKGKLKEGADVPALTRHLDVYRTFCDLAGAEIPQSQLPPRGRSLVPLLEDPSANWAERQIFVHCARWDDGRKNKLTREENRYKKCAIRTERWRLVDNARLYDISTDPGQLEDVATEHPDVVKALGRAYDQWWESTEPFLVNEGLPGIPRGEHHLQKLAREQAKEGNFPTLEPVGLDGQASRPPPSPQNLPGAGTYPTFNWERVPTYAHVGKASDDFTPEELDFLAGHFDFITIEKPQASHKHGSTEEGFVAAAREIKKRNPRAKVLFYWNASLDTSSRRGRYKAMDTFPEDGFLKDNAGNIVMRRKTVPNYDLTRQDVRDWWSDVAAIAVKEYGADGIFADAMGQDEAKGLDSKKLGALVAARVQLLEQTRRKIGPGKLILYNGLLKDDPGKLLQYADGAMIESFGHPKYGDNKEALAASFEATHAAAQKGKIVLLKGWPGFTFRDKTMMEKPRAVLRRLAKENINLPLAWFLVAAQQNSYFNYAWGYREMHGVFDVYPEFGKRLGPPKCAAVRDGWTYHREFKHASVSVDLELKKATIDWK